MPNTANYSWPTPADTDLVKNGADAIRDLGDAADTTVKSVADGRGLIHINSTSFTSASAVSLAQGTFTSTYRNYRIVFVVTSNSTNLNYTMRMRASGTDDSTNNYSNGFIGRTNNASTFTGDNDNQNNWELGGSDVGQQGIKLSLDFIDPQQTSKTFFNGTMNGCATSGAGGFGGAIIGGFHNTTTAFDSLSLIASTGNITGYYRIYAYKD